MANKGKRAEAEITHLLDGFLSQMTIVSSNSFFRYCQLNCGWSYTAIAKVFRAKIKTMIQEGKAEKYEYGHHQYKIL